MPSSTYAAARPAALSVRNGRQRERVGRARLPIPATCDGYRGRARRERGNHEVHWRASCRECRPAPPTATIVTIRKLPNAVAIEFGASGTARRSRCSPPSAGRLQNSATSHAVGEQAPGEIELAIAVVVCCRDRRKQGGFAAVAYSTSGRKLSLPSPRRQIALSVRIRSGTPSPSRSAAIRMYVPARDTESGYAAEVRNGTVPRPVLSSRSSVDDGSARSDGTVDHRSRRRPTAFDLGIAEWETVQADETRHCLYRGKWTGCCWDPRWSGLSPEQANRHTHFAIAIVVTERDPGCSLLVGKKSTGDGEAAGAILKRKRRLFHF